MLIGGWYFKYVSAGAGMNKMVINHLDKLFVTSDASTIINEMEVQHPAAKLVVFASQAQEQEMGDGTNFVRSQPLIEFASFKTAATVPLSKYFMQDHPSRLATYRLSLCCPAHSTGYCCSTSAFLLHCLVRHR